MNDFDRVWKIRDKATGLFWGGPKRECSEKIGSRFTRRSTIDAAITLIIGARGHFPDEWEIIEAEIIENEVGIPRSGKWVEIDSKLVEIWMAVRKKYPGLLDRAAIELLENIRTLRRSGTLSDFVAIGLHKQNWAAGNWLKFSNRMTAFNVPKTNLYRMPNGWVCFRDVPSATAARLNDETLVLFNMNSLLGEIASMMNVDCADI